jgi:cytochrome c
MAAIVCWGVTATSQAQQPKSTWDGVYTAEQAVRGQQVLNSQCIMCHAENLQGGPGVPGVVGPAFMFHWNGKTVRELFEFIRSSMPPGQAGSLGDETYADVTAAILQANQFPAGDASELPSSADALQGIAIKREKP